MYNVQRIIIRETRKKNCFESLKLIDRCNLCVPTVQFIAIAEAPAGTICVKIIQIQEVPVPSLLKENPLLCHETEINIAIYKPEWYSQERKQHLLLEFIMNLKGFLSHNTAFTGACQTKFKGLVFSFDFPR
jgi:hypothetical protein